MSQSKPHWALVATGTFLLALLAAVVGLGGPEDAWLKTRAMLWGHPPPKIVSVEEAPRAPKGSYIATLRNPSLEEVVVTGYSSRAHSPGISGDDPANVGWANAVISDNGAVTVMAADEQPPEACSVHRYVALPRPLVIEPRGIRAIQFRPWKEPCVFQLVVHSDHGESEASLSISGFAP